MDPITLRIQTELLSELESEAEEYGYSSRAEYIRHILQNRLDTNPAMANEGGATSIDMESIQSNSEDIDSIQSELSDIDMQISALESKVEALSQKMERGQANGVADVTNSSSENQEAASSSAIENLEIWLNSHGPQSEDAMAIIQEAAKILNEKGPMKAAEIKTQLYDEFPEAYGSENGLWGSTVGRVYEEAPGFSKPEYGIYDFDG
jgi:metal-responsive CopG/Arc/MetJ family transcriptional regulator